MKIAWRRFRKKIKRMKRQKIRWVKIFIRKFYKRAQHGRIFITLSRQTSLTKYLQLYRSFSMLARKCSICPRIYRNLQYTKDITESNPVIQFTICVLTSKRRMICEAFMRIHWTKNLMPSNWNRKSLILKWISSHLSRHFIIQKHWKEFSSSRDT